MKWIPAILSLFYLFSPALKAQSTKADSLKKILLVASDTAKVNTLHTLSYEVIFSHPHEAARYAQEALALAEKLSFYKGMASAYVQLGMCHDLQGNYDLAVDHYKKGLAVLDNFRVKNDHGYAALYNGLGLAYSRQGNYSDALTCFFKALDIAERINSRYAPNMLLNIGLIYFDQQEYQQALQYYFKCREQGEALNDQVVTGKAINNIGIVYKEMKRYREAIQYFELSLEKKKNLNDDLGISASLANLADVYKEMKDYTTALDYLNKAEALKRKVDDTWGLVFVNDVRAQIFIEQHDFEKAEAILHKNLALTSARGSTNKSTVYERLYELYRARNDYKNALDWYVKKQAFEDSLFNETKSKQLAELRTLYDVSNKEKEIVLLEKEREEERFIRNMILAGAAFLAVIAVFLFYFFRLRAKKRHELSKMQLALQQQAIENARLREEELQREITFKNKELASYTVNFVQKSELIEELKRTILSIHTDDAQLSKQLAALYKLVENSYQVDREWEDFRMQFENVHPGFFRSLKERCPELSAGDLKLCALLKLNMNLKEAAKVLGISPESVKTARYRLRKKLGLKQEENLVDYVLHVDDQQVLIP